MATVHMTVTYLTRSGQRRQWMFDVEAADLDEAQAIARHRMRKSRRRFHKPTIHAFTLKGVW